MAMLFDLNSANSLIFDKPTVDEKKIEALCFSETLLISCFHSKIFEKPIKLNVKETHPKILIQNVSEKVFEKPDLKNEEKYNNFYFYFFDQKARNETLKTESVILINGFPRLQSDKCNKMCCCHTMICFCDQVNNINMEQITVNCNTEDILNDEKTLEKSNIIENTNNHKEKILDITDSINDSMDKSSDDISCEIFESDDFQINNNCENLFVNSSTPVGGMTISIQRFSKSDDKFIIYTSSKYHKDGYNVGSELVSITEMDLYTVEENKIKYRKRENTFNQYKYHGTADNDLGFDLKISKNDGKDKITKRKHFNPNDAKSCISDGANVVLLRYLAITKYEGQFKTKSISSEGDSCDNIYICKIIYGSLIENQNIPLLKVTRRIVDNDGFMKEALYYLSLTGNLVRHEWSDSNYVIHLNPLLPINPETNEISRHVPLRKNWQNDMELFSKYMDFKNKRLVENEVYIKHHNQLRDLLSDYLETVLLMKPKEVLPFTRSYFGNFTERLDLPYNSYFEKND